MKMSLIVLIGIILNCVLYDVMNIKDTIEYKWSTLLESSNSLLRTHASSCVHVIGFTSSILIYYIDVSYYRSCVTRTSITWCHVSTKVILYDNHDDDDNWN